MGSVRGGGADPKEKSTTTKTPIGTIIRIVLYSLVELCFCESLWFKSKKASIEIQYSSSYIVGTETAKTNIQLSLLWIKFIASSNSSSTLRISISNIYQSPRVALEENTHNRKVFFFPTGTWLAYHARGNWCFLNCIDNSFFLIYSKMAFCQTKKKSVWCSSYNG